LIRNEYCHDSMAFQYRVMGVRSVRLSSLTGASVEVICILDSRRAGKLTYGADGGHAKGVQSMADNSVPMPS
jgi:hypothetical protein